MNAVINMNLVFHKVPHVTEEQTNTSGHHIRNQVLCWQRNASPRHNNNVHHDAIARNREVESEPGAEEEREPSLAGTEERLLQADANNPPSKRFQRQIQKGHAELFF